MPRRTNPKTQSLAAHTRSPVALRVHAYRQALAEAGLARAEVLLPQDVKHVVGQIADAEGTGFIDTLSALVQYGATQYAQHKPLSAPATRAVGAPAGNATQPESAPQASAQSSPLAAFLRKRKENTQ